MSFNTSIPGATTIIAELQINNNPDLAVVDAKFVRGGGFAVNTVAELNTYPTDLRKADVSRAYVRNAAKYYVLRGGVTNANWTEEVTATTPSTASTTIPCLDNQNMSARATTANFQSACDTSIVQTPAADGLVVIFLNGVAQRLGNGTRSGCDCYFSADSGTTARVIPNIQAGDFLYWVGSTAGFELETTDLLSFDYQVIVAS